MYILQTLLGDFLILEKRSNENFSKVWTATRNYPDRKNRWGSRTGYGIHTFRAPQVYKDYSQRMTVAVACLLLFWDEKNVPILHFKTGILNMKCAGCWNDTKEYNGTEILVNLSLTLNVFFRIEAVIRALFSSRSDQDRSAVSRIITTWWIKRQGNQFIRISLYWWYFICQFEFLVTRRAMTELLPGPDR